MRRTHRPHGSARAQALIAAVLIGTLTGCSAATTTTTTGSSTTQSSQTTQTAAAAAAGTTAAEVLAANQDVHDTSEAEDYDEADVVDVTLNDERSQSASDAVTVDGSTVTITAAGTYRLSGTLSDGQVVVSSGGDGAVRLVLDGANISSSTTAAIFFAEAGDAIVLLADGSTNTLSDTSSYAEDDDASGALTSAEDLTIAGAGTLDVTGNANDGIAGKDGLVILSGTITVTAVDDGIRGKDYLVIEGGTITVTSTGDALKADDEDEADRGFVVLSGGAVSVTTTDGDGIDATTDLVVTGGDLTVSARGGASATVDDGSTKGIKSGVVTVVEGGTITVDSSDDAVHSDGSIYVAGGDLTLATGDDGVHADVALRVSAGTVTVTESSEGLEAATIAIDGGAIDITASDDGLNASDGSGTEDQFGNRSRGESSDVWLTITGGTLVVDAGGDGLDSNGDLTITGGTTVVSGPTSSGNGALDANGTFTVSGGVLVAAGAAGMAETPSADSAQGWIAATFSGTQAAGTVAQVLDESGTLLATFESSKDFQSLVYSAPEISSGSTYEVATGGTGSGDTLGGLRASGDAGSATTAVTVTANESAGGGMGGPGSGMGGAGGVGGEPPTRGGQAGGTGEPPSGGSQPGSDDTSENAEPSA